MCGFFNKIAELVTKTYETKIPIRCIMIRAES